MIKNYVEYINESTELNRQFLKASKNSDINKVKKLLDTGEVYIEYNDEADDWTPIALRYHKTPLIAACENGCVEIVELLLKKGADIEAKDKSDWTPISYACWNGRIQTVRLLLDNGANINSVDNDGFTPLKRASRRGHKETFKLLLEYGADIKVRDIYNNMCLEYECKGVWKEEYTQELIITGQPINIKLFDDEIGILPSLKVKYKEIIEMSELGIFG